MSVQLRFPALRILSRSVSVPPVSPQVGDAYIVGSSPSGVWSGRGNDIAVWGLGGTWEIAEAKDGMAYWVLAENALYGYDGADWIPAAVPAAVTSVDLASGAATGVLPIAKGGTGETSAEDVLAAFGAVPLAGGTMIGDLILSGNPSTDLGAAPKQYVDSIVAAQDAMVFKGVIDCSTDPNYPSADSGWTHRVSVAGKIGGASGPNVQVGDILICLTDGTSTGDHATVGAAWAIIQANIDGALTTTDIGVSVQAYAAPLTGLAGLGGAAANRLVYTGGSDTFLTSDLTTIARNLLAQGSAGGMQSILLLTPGTHVQAFSAILALIASDAAWTETTPTPTSQGGTLGSASAVLHLSKVGRRVSFKGSVTVVTNGGGTIAVLMPTPHAPRDRNIFIGYETGVSNATLRVSINAGATNFVITEIDGSYPAVDGSVLHFNGSYEAAA